MFHLQGAIIRTDLYLVLVYDWDPNCLRYWGIVVYSVLIWLKMRLKWKTVFSKWSIVLKYTIKLELTIK
jgi:hypothetical protein